MKTAFGHLVALVAAVFLSSCGGGSSGPDTSSCPPWNPGDSMTYLRTEAVNGNSTETSMTYYVNDGAADTVTIWIRGVIEKLYAIAAGEYIPQSEDYFNGSTTTYTSMTAFCPPPAAGEKYEYTTWIPGPVEGTGDYIDTIVSVSGVSIDTVSVPAGNFTARKLVMDKTSWDGSTLVASGTITRYYVAGVGVVKEVEEIPAENTSITDVLTSYSYQ